MKRKLIEKVPYMGAAKTVTPDNGVIYGLIGRAGTFEVDGEPYLFFFGNLVRDDSDRKIPEIRVVGYVLEIYQPSVQRQAGIKVNENDGARIFYENALQEGMSVQYINFQLFITQC